MSLLFWESVFDSYKNVLKNPSDVLFLFSHWKLLKEGYLCVGSGDNFGDESEVLPGNWNSDPNVFQVNYQDANKNKYIFKAIVTGDVMILNFLRCCDNKTTDVTINIQEQIGDFKQFQSVLKDSSQLLEKVTSLLSGLSSATTSSSTQVDPQEQRTRERVAPPTGVDPRDNDPLRAGPRPQAGPSTDWDRPGAPPRLGSSDLDPLGRMGGGGMIMDPPFGGRDPMRPRWDPVGPMTPFGGPGGGIGGGPPRGGGRGRGGRGRRGNFGDEMQPPGWDNDFPDHMFM